MARSRSGRSSRDRTEGRAPSRAAASRSPRRSPSTTRTAAPSSRSTPEAAGRTARSASGWRPSAAARQSRPATASTNARAAARALAAAGLAAAGAGRPVGARSVAPSGRGTASGGRCGAGAPVPRGAAPSGGGTASGGRRGGGRRGRRRAGGCRGRAQRVGDPLGLGAVEPGDHDEPVGDGRADDRRRQHAPVVDDGERPADRRLGQRGERPARVVGEPQRQGRVAGRVALEPDRLDARRRQVQDHAPDPDLAVGGRHDGPALHAVGVAGRVGRDGGVDAEPGRRLGDGGARREDGEQDEGPGHGHGSGGHVDARAGRGR